MKPVPVLLSIGAASILAAGCLSSTSLDDRQQAVIFRPVIADEVRSGQYDFSRDLTMDVWAIDPESGNTIMDRTVFTNTGTYWEASPVVYWPDVEYLCPVACAPDSLSSHQESGTLTIKDFRIETGDEDLLYSTANQAVSNNTEIIELPFRRALCKIDFRVASAMGDNVRIRIEKLSLLSVSRTGDLKANSKAQWTIGDDRSDVVFYEAGADTVLLGSKPEYYGDTQKMIPQATMPVIRVEYSYSHPGTAWISGQYVESTPIVTSWEAGRYYTYTITMLPNGMTYTSGIGNWSDR